MPILRREERCEIERIDGGDLSGAVVVPTSTSTRPVGTPGTTSPAAATTSSPPTSQPTSRPPSAPPPTTAAPRPAPGRPASGSWRLTTYYTAVEQYHHGQPVEVTGCSSQDCDHGHDDLGSYPDDFVSAVKDEGTGRITSGPHAGRYMNWSYDVGY